MGSCCCRNCAKYETKLYELNRGNYTIIKHDQMVHFSVIKHEIFRPSYEYQQVHEWQHVPPGLEIRLSFGAEGRSARIPHQWKLALHVDGLGGRESFRVQVARDWTLEMVERRIADELGTSRECVKLAVRGSPSAAQKTVEQSQLFDAWQMGQCTVSLNEENPFICACRKGNICSMRRHRVQECEKQGIDCRSLAEQETTCVKHCIAIDSADAKLTDNKVPQSINVTTNVNCRGFYLKNKLCARSCSLENAGIRGYMPLIFLKESKKGNWFVGRGHCASPKPGNIIASATQIPAPCTMYIEEPAALVSIEFSVRSIRAVFNEILIPLVATVKRASSAYRLLFLDISLAEKRYMHSILQAARNDKSEDLELEHLRLLSILFPNIQPLEALPMNGTTCFSRLDTGVDFNASEVNATQTAMMFSSFVSSALSGSVTDPLLYPSNRFKVVFLRTGMKRFTNYPQMKQTAKLALKTALNASVSVKDTVLGRFRIDRRYDELISADIVVCASDDEECAQTVFMQRATSLVIMDCFGDESDASYLIKNALAFGVSPIIHECCSGRAAESTFPLRAVEKQFELSLLHAMQQRLFRKGETEKVVVAKHYCE